MIESNLRTRCVFEQDLHIQCLIHRDFAWQWLHLDLTKQLNRTCTLNNTISRKDKTGLSITVIILFINVCK